MSFWLPPPPRTIFPWICISSVIWIGKACSCLRAFAYAILSAWTLLPRCPHVSLASPPSSIYSVLISQWDLPSLFYSKLELCPCQSGQLVIEEREGSKLSLINLGNISFTVTLASFYTTSCFTFTLGGNWCHPAGLTGEGWKPQMETPFY